MREDLLPDVRIFKCKLAGRIEALGRDALRKDHFMSIKKQVQVSHFL